LKEVRVVQHQTFGDIEIVRHKERPPVPEEVAAEAVDVPTAEVPSEETPPAIEPQEENPTAEHG
jgi:hypothetical protein